jgi:hypothetical protein
MKLNMGYLEVKELNNLDEAENWDQPYLIRGGCSNMPAVKKWDLEYLNQILSEDRFIVEFYNTLDDMGVSLPEKQGVLFFKDFIELCKRKTPPYYYIGEFNLDEYIDENHIIHKDIQHSTKSKLDDKYKWSVFFLGNSCRTGSHIHIQHDFILNQVFNEKTIYLYDFDKKYLKERKIYDYASNFSEENFFTADHTDKEIYKAVLKPGDSIYIPPWWWHATDTEGISCSITKVYKRKDTKYLRKHPKVLSLYLYIILKTILLLFFVGIRSLLFKKIKITEDNIGILEENDIVEFNNGLDRSDNEISKEEIECGHIKTGVSDEVTPLINPKYGDCTYVFKHRRIRNLFKKRN